MTSETSRRACRALPTLESRHPSRGRRSHEPVAADSEDVTTWQRRASGRRASSPATSAGSSRTSSPSASGRAATAPTTAGSAARRRSSGSASRASTCVISLIPRPHNLHNYDELGVQLAAPAVPAHRRPAALPASSPTPSSRRLLAEGKKVLIHRRGAGRPHLGFVAGYLLWAGLVDPSPRRPISLIEHITGRQMGPVGRRAASPRPPSSRRAGLTVARRPAPGGPTPTGSSCAACGLVGDLRRAARGARAGPAPRGRPRRRGRPVRRRRVSDDLADTVDYGALSRRRGRARDRGPSGSQLLERLAGAHRRRRARDRPRRRGRSRSRCASCARRCPSTCSTRRACAHRGGGRADPTCAPSCRSGSNLGDRRAYLREAVDSLPDVVAVSPVYETDPVGGPGGQGPYLNLVVELDTDLTPRELLGVCHRLEAAAEPGAGGALGAAHARRRHPLDRRRRRSTTADLAIPHPRWPERRFVLAPLRDLAPDLVPERDRHDSGRRAASDRVDGLLNARPGGEHRAAADPHRRAGRAGGSFAAALGRARAGDVDLVGRDDDPAAPARGRRPGPDRARPTRAIADGGRGRSSRSPARSSPTCAGSLGLDVLAPHARPGGAAPARRRCRSPELGAERLRGALVRASAGDPIGAPGGRGARRAGGRGGRRGPGRLPRGRGHRLEPPRRPAGPGRAGRRRRRRAARGLPRPRVRPRSTTSPRSGPAAALTGPAARGDWATVDATSAALDPSRACRVPRAWCAPPLPVAGRDVPPLDV